MGRIQKMGKCELFSSEGYRRRETVSGLLPFIHLVKQRETARLEGDRLEVWLFN